MQDAVSQLDPATLYLTVNKRLATAMRQDYDESQHQSGHTVWPSLQVLPWRAWLLRAYTELVDSGHAHDDVLTGRQEVLLWEDIVTRQSEPSLLRPVAAAQLAMEAYVLCCDWQLDVEAVSAQGGQDVRIFARWHRSFVGELRRRRLLSRADLTARVHAGFADGQLCPPGRLCLAGFDRLSPAQQATLDLLIELGCVVDRFTPQASQAECRVFVARDEEQEIRAAARWAQQTLQQRPDASLGVIVPALGERKKTIRRLFTEELAPRGYLDNDTQPLPFNISLGDPLSDRPLVAHALLACRLLAMPLSINEIGVLLRSPFLGGFDREREARALFDATLRSEQRATIDLTLLISRLRRRDASDPAACPDLLARLQSLSKDHRPDKKTRPPSDWAEALRELLQALGWPGPHGLNSAEYQQYQRLVELLDELAGLGKVRRRVSYREAVALLSRIASDTVFQPQSGRVGVQILGPLEAAGLAFDGLWMLGLHDRQWPPAPQPHPLLPTGLQRERDMPHASADHELAFAASLMQQFGAATPRLIGSYPLRIDEQEGMPSPLILDWPSLAIGPDDTQPSTLMREACRDPGNCQPMPWPSAPAGPTNARGGAALLAAQASCPFAAVAAYRLGARTLDEPLFAPDAAMLGNLAHRLLQRTWNELEDSATLHGLSDEVLASQIRAHAAQLLEDASRQRPDLFTARFGELEVERLTQLAVTWLNTERERVEPFEIVALERAQDLELEGVNFSTRVDRIDRLADGSLAVIDYKTGRQVSQSGWFDERLTEPQLPLYSLLAGNDVGAALLARVRNDSTGCRFIGVARMVDSGLGKYVIAPAQFDETLDWSQLQRHWDQAIRALAAEFAAGRSDLTPSKGACEYCEFDSLCRVDERQQLNDD